MLDKLNLYFNKLRQEKITTEICESSVFLMKKD
jgi:F0F1-type ATP synthase gamma subunit